MPNKSQKETQTDAAMSLTLIPHEVISEALFARTWFLPGVCVHTESNSELYEPETFGNKVRRAYREGKLHDQIQKAEIDYAEGRALDTLY